MIKYTRAKVERMIDMKKLIVVAMIAGSMMAMADETAKPEAAKVATPVAEMPAKRQITPEQRAAMRAKFEQRMAARRAEMEKKAIEIIKKYGLDDEKAKALFAELEMAKKSSRRPRPNMKRPAKAPAPAPAAAPAKAE